MALTATMRRFEIALADSDRGVYEQLELRVAQHPSETDRYLVTRVIARCLEHGEGVDFTKGLAVDDEPAIWQRDLRNDLLAWIEVGSPSVDRLHKAQKTGARVAVYGWQRMKELAQGVKEREVHRREELAMFAIDPGFLDRVGKTLDRVNRWSLSLSGGTIYLDVAGKVYETSIDRVAID
jgi:uncharacterized protein YaeQ